MAASCLSLRLNHAFTRVEHWLFSDGLSFFLPYLTVYQLAVWLKIPTDDIARAFWFLHFAILLLALRPLAQVGRNLTLERVCWCLFFLLLFLLPGAYMEFPADPWEHLRRTFLFEKALTPGSNEYWYKAAYFWNWTLLWPFPLEARWVVLDLLSTFWQGMIAFHFFRFLRALEFDTPKACVGVLAFFLLFGQNLFSFRYYALSSTPIAYCAFLALSREWVLARPSWRVASYLFIAVTNHLQEILLMGVLGLGLVAAQLQQRHLYALSRAITIAVILALGSIALAPLIPQWLVQLPGVPGAFREKLLFVWQRGTQTGLVHSWQVYCLWKGQFWESISVTGILAVTWAVIRIRSRPVLAWLTLMPYLLLLFPPFVVLTRLVILPEAMYRLLYAFPSSIMVVDFLFTVLHRGLRRKDASSHLHWMMATASVVVLSLSPLNPLRGKLFFQTNPMSPRLTLRYFTPMAKQLSERAELLSCIRVPDPPTAFFLNTVFALERKDWIHPRLQPMYWVWEEADLPKLLLNSCAVLVPVLGVKPLFSKTGQWSGHWPPTHADPQVHIPAGFQTALEELLRRGWTVQPLGKTHQLWLPRH